MSEDLRWELDILDTVHCFYLGLLQHSLDEESVPVPAELNPHQLHSSSDLQGSVSLMRRWLKLLDMAITVPMVRDELTRNISQDTAEALLRYYARKRSASDLDRDKTDFAVTYLYRNPRVAGQWEMRGYSLDGIIPISPFEIALLEIFSDTELPVLPEEHAQLLNEFEYLKNEVEDFQDFNALMDSGIIQRVRDIKAALGASFYHPHALAVTAEYNAFFKNKFDELFRNAAQEIRTFAERVQHEGGSVSSRVEGDVTVKHLAEIHENHILTTEYRNAQDHFRHVSKLKKVVDKRRAAHAEGAASAPARASAPVTPAAPAYAEPATSETPAPPEIQPEPVAPAPAPPSASVTSAAVSSAPPPGIVRQSGSETVLSMSVHPSQQKVNTAIEDGKLRAVEESIRAFVRAADPKFRQIVPMRNGNFTLTPAEADAYCADHLDEKSFRADNARTLVRTVAIMARITTELEEFRQKQSATYLWKPHADSLTYLLVCAHKLNEDAGKILTLAQQRGLTEKVNWLNSSLTRLREKCSQVAKALENIPNRQ